MPLPQPINTAAVPAGCAFVQFNRWSEAEDAIEAHNGKTRLPGSDVPVVVKFADAKRRDTNAANARAALGQWSAGLRQQPPDLSDLAGAVSVRRCYSSDES